MLDPIDPIIRAAAYHATHADAWLDAMLVAIRC